MKDGRPRIVTAERIFDGWNKLDILTVEAPDADGTLRRHRRELVDHGCAAVVLPIDRTRGVVYLVKQWRTGLLNDDDPYLLEACAGLIDPGETPEETARREAEEEIGLKIGALRSLGTILPSIGNPHEGEEIEVVEMPLAELFQMARDGRIADAKTLIIAQRLIIEELVSA
jgi:nudix-type nucleoside diphosphatase (YffH/AdpP family)